MRSFALSVPLIGALLLPGWCPAGSLDDELLTVARKGDVEAVKRLLDKGANVNARSPYGVTPLWLAARLGHAAVVRLLVERGADVNAKEDAHQSTALGWATWKGHVEVIRILLEKGAEGRDMVLRAGVEQNNIELVRLALEKANLDPETLSDALATAARHNRAEIADLLKRSGAVLPPPADFPVETETLKTYVGIYKDEKEYEFVLSLKDGKLFALAPFGEEFALEPMDATTFRAPEFGARLLFQTEGGRALGFTLKTRSGKGTLYKKVEK